MRKQAEDPVTGHDDDLLREAFRRLRAETEASARTPDFRGMFDGATAEARVPPELGVVRGGQADGGTRRSRAVRIAGWAAAVAAAIGTVILVGDRPDADREFERLVAAYSAEAFPRAWRSPTSGLLEVPGASLTRSVPSLGTAIRGLDPGQRPNSPDPGGTDS